MKKKDKERKNIPNFQQLDFSADFLVARNEPIVFFIFKNWTER